MAFSFDGTNYWTPAQTWNLPADGTWAMSFEINATSDAADMWVMGQRASPTQGWALQRRFGNNNFRFITYNGAANNHDFSTNGWSHNTNYRVVLRCDNANVFLYTDGTEDSTQPAYTAPTATSNDDIQLEFGKVHYGSTWFTGTIGNITLYNADIGAAAATAISLGANPYDTVDESVIDYHFPCDSLVPHGCNRFTADDQNFTTSLDYDLAANWTVSFWAEWSSADVTGAILGRRNGTTAGWAILRQASGANIQFNTYNSGASSVNSANNSAIAGSPGYYCLRCNGSNVLVYKDNALVSTLTWVAPAALASVGLHIGAVNNNATPESYHYGRVTDIALFSTDVGATAALRLSNGESPLVVGSPDHFWKVGDTTARAGATTLTAQRQPTVVAGLSVDAVDFPEVYVTSGSSISIFTTNPLASVTVSDTTALSSVYNRWSTDPLWVNPAVGNFRPQRASTMIDTGVTVANIGQTVKGAAPDAGSVEWAGIVPPMPGRKSRVSMSMRL